jgi:hypothetical protein
MSKDRYCVESVCLPFCKYYKPGRNEELVCKAYTVVERLIRQGKTIKTEASEQEIDREMSELIVQKVCMACDFHERDCDFMEDRTASPCGGFILLARLLMAGTMTREDIE